MRFGAAASLAEEGEVDDADGAAEPLDEPTQDVAAVAAGITAIMPLTIADDDEYFEYEHALAHVAIESTATMPLTADYERNDGCFESESRSAETTTSATYGEHLQSLADAAVKGVALLLRLMPAAVFGLLFAWWAQPVGAYSVHAIACTGDPIGIKHETDRLPLAPMGIVKIIADSGASSACISSSNPWLAYLKHSTVEANPHHGGVKVGDAQVLQVTEIIDLRFRGQLSLKGFRFNDAGQRVPAAGDLTCHRVLVVRVERDS